MQWSYVTDFLDLPSSITLGGSRVTSFGYDHRGRRTFVDEPDTVDHLGAPVTNIRTTAWFPHGQVRELSGTPGYRTTYSYDHAHRLETLTTYGTQTAVTRWERDTLRGFLTGKKYNSPTAGTGTGMSYSYTPAGRLATRTNARGTIATHSYDSAGRPGGVSYDDGNTPGVTFNTRDRLGRPTSITDGTGTRAVSYSDFDQPETTIYQNDSPLDGWEIVRSHDGLARLSALAVDHTPAGGPAATVYETSYDYDAAGRTESVSTHGLVNWLHYHPTKHLVAQSTVSDATGPIHYGTRSFDALNRLSRVSYHNGLPATANFQVHSDYHYQRDALGRIESATLADQTQWRYQYNTRGELATATRHLDSSPPSDRVLGHSLSYAYDGIGNRSAKGEGGDASGSNTYSTSYTANALNQYTAVNSPSLTAVFGEAPTGTTVTVNGTAAARQGPWFYREESANNASGPDWHAFTISHATGTDSGHLLVAPASASPSYDADGNLTNDGKFAYSWDAESRLTGIEPAAGSPQPYFRIAYHYDSENRRVLREKFDTPSATTPVTTTKYLFAGWRCLGEADGTDSLQKSYVWGVDGSDLLHLGDPNSALLWIHDYPSNETHLAAYDGNGNLTVLTSAQTKQPTAAYHYSPFGKLLCQTGSYAAENPFKFSTQHHDPTTGLPYYGHRWLNPETGRWLNRDTIEEAGGVNLYAFTGNDGVNGYDVLGMFLKTIDYPQNASLMREYFGTKNVAKAAAAAAAIGVADGVALDIAEQTAERVSARETFSDAGCPELFDAYYPDRHHDWNKTARAGALGAAIGAVTGYGIGKFAPVALKWGGGFLASRFPGVHRAANRAWDAFANRPITGLFRQGSSKAEDTALNWVQAIEKGQRPHPATYLSVSERAAHAKLFEGGVARIAPEAPSGVIGVTETWVLPRSLVDDLITQSSGNPRTLEKLLGLDEGYLGKAPVLIEIPNPTHFRIPTGNEFGANSFWRPGGYTSGSIPEAIVAPVEAGGYTAIPIFK